MIVELKAALVALFTDDPDGARPVEALTHVVQVLSGEPRPGELMKPLAITVSTAGLGDTVSFTVRIYAATDADALRAHVLVDETVDQVEDLLDGDARFAQGDWSFSYVPTLDVLVAECAVSAGRTDY